MTSIVSSDGEYEWGRIICAEDLPSLGRLLSAPPDADILDVLERSWSGSMAGRLEERIRESGSRAKLWVRGG
jgi:hypothetical protein